MALLDIPTKATGDTLTAVELNNIVTAIKKLQSEKGHATYFDTQYTDVNPQVFNSNIFEPLNNNRGNIIEDYLPYGVNSLFDGTKILPPSLGAGLSGYVSFYAKSSNTNSYFDFGIDIQGNINEIFESTRETIRGADTYQSYYLPINGYMLGTFLANGGTPVIKPKTNNTISVYGVTFHIGITYQQ